MKPICKYKAFSEDNIHVGKSAHILAVDHYRLGSRYVITSTVISVDNVTGNFETLNTRYERE